MKDKKFDVIVIGELNVDLIFDNLGSKLPEIGKEIIAGNMILTLGSSSAILASNLSILGSRVSFLGKVGADAFADLILNSLKEKDVDISSIMQTSEYQTGITVACSYGNDRAMVTYPGAMDHLTIDDITPGKLKTAKHMHLSSVFLQPGLRPDIVELFRMAKKTGLTTSFDPQWDPHEKWDVDLNTLLPYVDVFMPNLREIQCITGTSSLEAAINTVKDVANIVVVKDGVNGSYTWSKQEQISQGVFNNPDVVDTIGAGDSFNAGFLSKYVKMASLKECVEFGALAGAINTTSAGGTTAFVDFKTIKKVAFEVFGYQM